MVTKKSGIIRAAAVLVGSCALAAAQAATTNDGVYTAGQAQSGSAHVRAKCVSCHGDDLLGRGFATSLLGEDFFQTFGSKSVGELYAIVKTMPVDKPGSLTEQEYVEVTAYLLQANGFPPGRDALTGDTGALARIRITPPQQGTNTPATRD